MHTREYLLDLVPASLFVYGMKSADELIAFLPKMSLQTQGLLGKPAAPILVVGTRRYMAGPGDLQEDHPAVGSASPQRQGSWTLTGAAVQATRPFRGCEGCDQHPSFNRAALL